ncbi:MAG: hypothetical protein HUJ26_22660 [Planctomycetaceae bacterium]|nr:hypothetical protein [Planctomycetaceae bacterium]
MTLIGALGNSISAQDNFQVGDPLPQIVRDDWDERRQQCQTVHWKLNAREMFTPGSLNLPIPDHTEKYGPLPKENSFRERGFELWIDFDGLKVRSESDGENFIFREEKGKHELRSYREAALFDGEKFQKYEPDQQVKILNKSKGSTGFNVVFEAIHLPLFWSRGKLFGPGAPLHPDKLDRNPDFESFRIQHYDPVNRLLTVRAPEARQTFIDYEFDLNKQSAITRMTMYSGDRLTRETVVEWHQEGELWLPTRWTMSTYRGLNSELEISSECTVEIQECGVDLSDVEFHMEPEPGEPYYNEEERTSYVKGKAGESDVPRELAKIQSGVEARQRLWIVSAAVLAGGLLVGAWWMRRKGLA